MKKTNYLSQTRLALYHPCPRGGGDLVERWVRGCAAQIGCFFGLSGFAMAPFLFENWFRYRSRFCKMHNSDEFVLWFIYRLSKSTLPAECKKVVSDIFGEIEFLMEYRNIGLYAHFALFSKFLALLFSKILSKMCSKNATFVHYCTNI